MKDTPKLTVEQAKIWLATYPLVIVPEATLRAYGHKSP